MKSIPIAILMSTLILLLACPVLPAQTSGEPPVSNARFETLSPAAGLEAALKQARSRDGEPFWVGYSVPMVAGQGRNCCFTWKKGSDPRPSVCLLEGKNNGWGSTSRDEPRPDQRLHVLLRFAGGKVGEIRGFSEDCAVDAGGRRFVWLGAVKPEESVSYLADLARTGQGGNGDPGEEAMVALAMHRNANADTALEELASPPSSRKTREHALFWLGQTRGERGARFLANVLRDDRDEDIREKAVFSLSQSRVPWAAETIARTGREDRSPGIRGEALFWLAQMDAPEAPETLFQAIEKDPEMEVRKKAVFALSQLKGGKSVSYLVRVGKETRQPEIRKEAFFWLAQSNDPEALKYLDKVLNDD
ncbi:MAG TPA: HEAT repeat domain-containing protein [Thermoanaerobaculia bacterium]